ncbi:hypothetical protein Csa_017506 [Cucumis sativus]|uniref:Uncharacterized protein n=1 Tax=Cucumis sativus TaxID=3659 RepID=A0A0A0L8N3_CUCSA|nr:hypothetical protein Csa_017506 [Cucumis sativus]
MKSDKTLTTNIDMFPPPPQLLAGALSSPSYSILLISLSSSTAPPHFLQRQLIDTDPHYPVARRLPFFFIFGNL